MAAQGKSRLPALLDRAGIFPPLALGYLGLLVFMIGDGVESGFLSPYLRDRGLTQPVVAMVFTLYGVMAAAAAWFSGTLSDLWGPRRVMWLGLCIWIVFELALLLALPSANWPLVIGSYALRGLGYPLFAFGFLVWITAASPRRRLGTGVGWFWFAFTGGLPTLGSFLASFTVPAVGPYQTLWYSLGLVVLGGLTALLGTHEPTGLRPLANTGDNAFRTLASGVTIGWKNPKIAIGMVVRIINTAPQFGFLVFLPIFFTETIGFSLAQWLRILGLMFLSNIIWNLLFGIIGDKFGWRRTVAVFGGLGSAVATLLLFYVPQWFGANYALTVAAAMLYGATLAGYVPLSALMPTLAPENKGAAMSMLNLGAGASTWVGPAIVGLFLGPLGVAAVMWVFAVLYLLSAVLTLSLTLPPDAREPDPSPAAEVASR
jgi:polyol permease family